MTLCGNRIGQVERNIEEYRGDSITTDVRTLVLASRSRQAYHGGALALADSSAPNEQATK